MKMSTFEKNNAGKNTVSFDIHKSASMGDIPEALPWLLESISWPKTYLLPAEDSSKPMANKSSPSKKVQRKSDLKSPKINTTRPMDKSEALNAILDLINNEQSKMRICYELAVREGYIALGYKSFKECIQKKLAGIVSYDSAHKLKQAGVVHMTVCPEIPMGEIPEGVLRPLSKYPAKIQKKIWNDVRRDMNCVDFDDERPTIRDVNAATKAHERKNGGIVISDMKSSLRYVEFSPALMKKMQKCMQETIDEYIDKTTVDPISEKYFDAAVRILLNAIASNISSQYKKLHAAE